MMRRQIGGMNALKGIYVIIKFKERNIEQLKVNQNILKIG